jgi:hypothetical protein
MVVWEKEESVLILRITIGFMAKVIKNLGLRLGYKTIHTSAYSPSTNGACERFHAFMNAALTIFADRYRSAWHEYLDAVLFAYRISVNESTGYSPFYLMYGREPAFPVDFYYGPEAQSFEDERQHGLRVSRALREAYHVVRKTQKKAADRRSARRDKHQVSPPRLAVGSRVLLWEPEPPFLDNHGVLVNKRKLLYRYSGPHQIVHDDNESPGLMYWIRRDDAGTRDKKQRVNSNRLWKFEYLEPDTLQRGSQEISDREWQRDPPPKEDAPEAAVHVPDADTKLEEGQFVVIPLEIADNGEPPFGIGKVLQHHKDGHIDLHWFGSTNGHPVGTYRPGWLNKHSRTYFRSKPEHWKHRRCTNDDTGTTVTLEHVAGYGFALSPKCRLPPAVVKFLHHSEAIPWQLPTAENSE